MPPGILQRSLSWKVREDSLGKFVMLREVVTLFRNGKVSDLISRKPAFLPDDIRDPDPADTGADEVTLRHQVEPPFGKVIDCDRDHWSFVREGARYRDDEQPGTSGWAEDHQRPDLYLPPLRDAERSKEDITAEIGSHG